VGSRSPSECKPGTNSLEGPRRSMATCPMRDMMRMLATTYGLSVTSTPTLLIGEVTGPIMYGTTYMVRPRMAPSKSAPTLCFAASGSIQLLVGPASSLAREQIKVRCSVRATSFTELRWRLQFGYVFSFSVMESPARSISSVMRRYSVSEPSQYTMRSGLVSLAASSTQFSRGVANLFSPPADLPSKWVSRTPIALSVKRLAMRGHKTKWRRPCQQASLRRELTPGLAGAMILPEDSLC